MATLSFLRLSKQGCHVLLRAQRRVLKGHRARADTRPQLIGVASLYPKGHKTVSALWAEMYIQDASYQVLLREKVLDRLHDVQSQTQTDMGFFKFYFVFVGSSPLSHTVWIT